MLTAMAGDGVGAATKYTKPRHHSNRSVAGVVTASAQLNCIIHMTYTANRVIVRLSKAAATQLSKAAAILATLDY